MAAPIELPDFIPDAHVKPLPGAAAVLGPDTYFGKQLAGQREDLQSVPLVNFENISPPSLKDFAKGATEFTTPTNLAIQANLAALGSLGGMRGLAKTSLRSRTAAEQAAFEVKKKLFDEARQEYTLTGIWNKAKVPEVFYNAMMGKNR